MRHKILTGLTALMMLAFAGVASAQVLIDMPPAKSPPAKPTSSSNQAGAAQPLLITAVAPISATVPATSASVPDVGDVALIRYSRARLAPGDVYHSNPRYAGIRSYSSPFSDGHYPFWFWWGGGHGHNQGHDFGGCRGSHTLRE